MPPKTQIIKALHVGTPHHGDVWQTTVGTDFNMDFSPFSWKVSKYCRWEPHFEHNLHLLVDKKATYQSIKRQLAKLLEEGKL